MEIRYRVYGEETGVLPLRQGVKETVNSPYNSEPLSRTSNPSWVYGEETGILPPRQGEKETVDSPYNSKTSQI